MDETEKTMTKIDKDWERELTPEQYRVLREHGTERAGTSPLNNEKRIGRYFCAGCGKELFESGTKYESGSGWPSFYAPMPGAVETSTDSSHGMTRTEVHCARCGGSGGGEPIAYRRSSGCHDAVAKQLRWPRDQNKAVALDFKPDELKQK